MAERVHTDGLTARELVVLTGVSYRQIDHWTRRGWLHPTPRDGAEGVPRMYPAGEVDVASRMAALVAAGFTPLAAAERARVQHDRPPGLESGMARVRTYMEAFRERFRL